jgi:ribosomal protein S18 acetylase RimI-like enzyme
MSRSNGESGSLRAVRGDQSVEFHEVKDASSDDFKEAMKIYLTSFPENERRPVSSIEKDIKRGQGRLIIGRMDNRVVSMALFHPIKGTPYLFGDYIAIAEEFRSRGIGEQLLKNVFNILNDAEFDHLFGEFENPYFDENELKMRRVNYFKRMGMKELKDVRYILPPLQGNLPTEMILMVFSKTDKDCLDREEVRDMLIRIFKDIYERNEDDEILDLILAGLPEIIWLA